MNIVYCDCCGKEILKMEGALSFRAQRTFPRRRGDSDRLLKTVTDHVNGKSVAVMFEAIVTWDDENGINQQGNDICDSCILNAVIAYADAVKSHKNEAIFGDKK